MTSRLTAPTAASKAKTIVVKASENAVPKRRREILVEVPKSVANSNVDGPGDCASGTTEKNILPDLDEVCVRASTVALEHLQDENRCPAEACIDGAHSEHLPLTGGAYSTGESFDCKSYTSTHSTSSKRRVIIEEPEEPTRVFKRPHTEPIGTVISVPDKWQGEALVVVEDPAQAEVDAEPTVQPWDDLDAEDWDDPSMVSEYVVDICAYWKECEVCLESFPHKNIPLT